MIWNESVECAPRGELQRIQSERLVETVQRVYHSVPAYRHKMQEAGLVPGDIRDVGDLRKLPFTTKGDLRDNYPFGMFTVPMSEIVRVHASSGTTGKPTVVGYTRKDLHTWAEVVSRSLCMAGVHRNDVVQVAYGYGLFTGGLGLHYGTENLGATVIPISGGNTEKQIMLMQDFGTTVIACTPSYALFLAEVMRDMGIAPGSLKLKTGIFGAEPWSENMRREIEQKLGLKAIDIYGLSEIIGPGVSCECEEQAGMHINEDHFYPEIIDPDTGAVLPDGEEGELVFTTLSKEGIPMLRYRTRDITRLNREPCRCGRTNVRMELVRGRSDDMMVIRGVNVFPSQIEEVLLQVSGIGPHYQILVTEKEFMDRLEVQVELTDGDWLESYARLESLTNEIRQKIRIALQIDVKVTLLNPQTLERTAGKAKRVVDLRQNRKF